MSLIISSRRSNKSSLNLSKDGSYAIPEGTVIDLIKLVPSVNMAAVKIGTTPGGEEILPAQALTGGDTSFVATLLDGGTTIYFSGITAAMAITLFRK
jgi:hypothetical protein